MKRVAVVLFRTKTDLGTQLKHMKHALKTVENDTLGKSKCFIEITQTGYMAVWLYGYGCKAISMRRWGNVYLAI